MDARWMTMPTGSEGLLSGARNRLDDVVARARRLADETAWECAAARQYRDDLAAWVDLLLGLQAGVADLEWDARLALRELAGVGG